MTTSLDARGSAPGDQIRVGRDRLTVKVTSEQTAGEVAVLEVTIPPGGGPPMLHRHDPFELYRVRSGELAIYLEGKGGAVTRTVAGPGAAVPIGGGVEHTVRNESDEDARATVVFSPGAAMERFFRAAGALGQSGTPGLDEVHALAEAHGIEMTRSIEDALTGETGLVPASSPAYLTIARFSGDGDQLLDRYREYSDVMARVGKDHGLIVHAGGKTDGGFLVVNLWPSKERSEAAARDPRRLAVIENAQVSPDEIRREHHVLAHFQLLDPQRCAA